MTEKDGRFILIACQRTKKALIFVLAIAFPLFISISNANAGCSLAGGCGGAGDWESTARSFLSSDVPGFFLGGSGQAGAGGKSSSANVTESTQNNSSKSPADYVSPPVRSDLFINGWMLKPLLCVSNSDVIIDVSNGDGYSTNPHVKGAIHLPSRSLLHENGTLRPVQDMGKILGEAGISSEDGAVIYGDSMASGDPTFVFWAMRYLGQENAKVMDGGLADWIASSLPLELERETGQRARQARNYNLSVRHELLADFEYVKSEEPQLIDARNFVDLGKGRIPGSIFLEPAQVLEAGKIKNPADLNETFSRLSRDRPVVVYSEDGFGASVVWYALQLMGYDSRLYTWKDWQAHQSPGGVEAEAFRIGTSSPVVIDKSKYKKLGR